jgi:hypothetical protein
MNMRNPSMLPGVLSVALVGVVACGAAGAQTMGAAGPLIPYCGAWISGTWTPNGNCTAETTTTSSIATTHVVKSMPQSTTATSRTRPIATTARVPQRVAGTITAVNGHLVTIQRAKQQLVIDDQPALEKQATGRVAVGRVISAHGYWQDGTFLANGIDTAS